MKKVVVSGATSMLGTALINECLKHNIEVMALVRPGSVRSDRLPKSPLIKTVETELSDDINITDSGNDYDAFFHFAWSYTNREGRNDPILQSRNIQFTLAAVRLANKLGCKKFIGAGSQAEYGPVNGMITEKTPANPQVAYGISKYAAGKLSRMLCDSYNMDCIWVRIFSVYGINDGANTMISYVTDKLLNGEKPSLSSGEQLWDYLYEDDAGRAFYLMGEKTQGHKLYCLGYGKSVKLKKYVETIRDIVSPDAELGFGENNSNVFSLQVDISKLTKDTGFVPLIDFKSGMEKVIAAKKR